MARAGKVVFNQQIPDYILLQDEKAVGTPGGSIPSVNTWFIRDLTIERVDTGNHCTLASNKASLLAGTYRYLISAPAYYIVRHQIRLYNFTDSAVVEHSYGTSEFSTYSQSRSVASGHFTITSTKQVQVEHIMEGPSAGVSDLGVATGGVLSTPVEVYTKAEFWRMPL